MINKAEIRRRVQGYIERMGHNVPRYPLDKVDNYQIVGGASQNGTRETIGFAQGRLVDVIEYASQLDGFTGDWCSWDLPTNTNHGKILTATLVLTRKDKELDDLI